MIFPETYFLISVFTGFSLWLIIHESQDLNSATMKKFIAMIFAFLSMMIVSTLPVTYLVYQDRSVSVSDVMYIGSTNKIDNVTNSYLSPFIQRLTTPYPQGMFDLLRSFFVAFFFISLGLFVYTILLRFSRSRSIME